MTLQPGTVIPAGGLLYVSPDVVAFRARASGPGGFVDDDEILYARRKQLDPGANATGTCTDDDDFSLQRS